MFMGKTMVDIELIKPDEISKNLCNFLEKKHEQIYGSLADMLVQNDSNKHLILQ